MFFSCLISPLKYVMGGIYKINSALPKGVPWGVGCSSDGRILAPRGSSATRTAPREDQIIFLCAFSNVQS